MENEMRHKIVLMTGGTETLEFFFSTRQQKKKVQKNFTILQQLMTRYLSLLTLTVFIMRLHFLT